MKKLFGTDGIRGVANEHPMTPEMAVKIGRAGAFLFKGDKSRTKIIIGKDTRISGSMLECALVSGICSVGADAYRAEILPTPGVAFMTSSTDAGAGIVISASHNPFYDNGIKFFNGNGCKLSDEMEGEIEKLIEDENIISRCRSIRETGRVYETGDAGNSYSDFLKQALPGDCSFRGMKIIIDCSNGATYRIAPAIFDTLGADIESLFINPDGKNINENCGSQHPETLVEKVLEKGADLGLSFDGDGDRLLAVDEMGNVISGDRILAVCAKAMQQKGTLKNNIVVSTVMSNMGLMVALKDLGIKHVMADVGDRYVLEKMIASGAVLGGEDSGHMIFLDYHTTGDGILTGLRLLEIMREEAKPLSELCKVMTVFPQVLINVNVKTKPDIETVAGINDAIRSAEAQLGEKGRVLVRYSGTEPLCRIMVEGPSQEETHQYCRRIADVVREKLGA